MHVGKLIPILEEAGQEIPEELIEMSERARKNRERRLDEKNRERKFDINVKAARTFIPLPSLSHSKLKVLS